jgi:acetoin utilization deacetylase AcuC-like enzyme
MRTGIVTDERFLDHDTGRRHPECADRLRAIGRWLEANPIPNRVPIDARDATIEELTRIHVPEHVERVEVSAHLPRYAFDADTPVSPRSFAAACRAAGGVLALVDAVMAGRVDNGFAFVRPPGHHAERDRAMGFCLFNNVALAAAHLRAAHGLERVLVVDWDVHHGNGTQDIFWDDPSVLFCSTHQMPLYPGTGAKDENGAHGTIVNAPLSPNVGSDHFREAFKSRVLPALNDFRPDIIIISAGFDAHHRDPLAQINLTGEDFDWATGRLLEVADRSANNRVVSLLEGGYDLEGLAESAGMHILRMMKG